jgi:uncharacterized membrane protein YGL010W
MSASAARPGWTELFELYRAAHQQPGTKLTHLFGIPMIVVSLPLTLLRPKLGLGLCAGGWALQFIGHYVFEHNDPQFFGDPRNLLVGVAWSAAEWAELLGWRRGAKA